MFRACLATAAWMAKVAASMLGLLTLGRDLDRSVLSLPWTLLMMARRGSIPPCNELLCFSLYVRNLSEKFQCHNSYFLHFTKFFPTRIVG